MGLSEYEAKRYEGIITGERCFVAVHSEDSREIEKAKQILEAELAEDISTASVRS